MGKEEQLRCGNENWEDRVQAQYLVHQPSWVLTMSQTGRAHIPWPFPYGHLLEQFTVHSIPGGLLPGRVPQSDVGVCPSRADFLSPTSTTK